MLTRSWQVVLCAALFFFYEFFQINMFNALDVSLMQAFGVDGAALSLLSAAYFYGVILLLIPAGLILDRVSTKRLILVTLAISIVGTLMFSLAQSMSTAALGRFLVGVSAGPFCFLSVIRLAQRWFDSRQLATVTGLIVAIGMLGGVCAQAPFTYLVTAVGWREALWVNVVAGVAFWLLIAKIVEDCPPQHIDHYKQQQQEVKTLGILPALRQVSRRALNWQCGIFASLTNLPVFILGALWGNLYLTQAHGLDRMEASLVSTMIYFGMLLGSPFFGRVSDHLQQRRALMLLGGIFTGVVVMIITLLDNATFPQLLTLFFVMGFGSGTQIIAYPTVAENNPSEMMGTAEGLAATLIMAGGAVFQPVFGMLVSWRWDGATVNGIASYTASNYFDAMLLLPVMLLLAVGIVYYLREKQIRMEYEPA